MSTHTTVRARRAGFLRDVWALGRRALRGIPRDPESVLPALIIPVFFFTVNVGALQDVAEGIPGVDYKAFQLPVAILFAVTGVSRANVLVLDIQGGYFDRLALTPVNRLAMLLGFMVADVALALALMTPVVLLGLALGVGFETGVLGVLAFLGLGAVWALVYNGFPYAIALKTGNPAAVNSSFLLFFPVLFLAPVFLPREVMTGWMATVAGYNPTTYMLEGMRSLITGGWDAGAIAGGAVAIAAIGVVSIPLALWALLGRVRRA